MTSRRSAEQSTATIHNPARTTWAASLPRRLGVAALAIVTLSQLAMAAPTIPGAYFIPPGSVAPTPPSQPIDSIVPSTAGAIRLPGGGGVSDDGAATYTLPLQVPPGPGELQPSLALSYQGEGNGLVGVGFGLAGLSVIAPCAKTIASEGVADGVDFDLSDSYCLDGQKLVMVENDDLLTPTVERIYRTEVDNFDRVAMRFSSSAAKQPSTIEVRRRDGLIATYEPVLGVRRRGIGNDDPPELVGSDERQASVAVAYPIRKLEDRSSNRLVYTYTVDTPTSGNDHELAYRIANIAYSFNSSERRRVQFAYESRPDPIVQYLAGVKVVVRHRLKAIEMGAPMPVNLAKAWRYELGYETGPDTARSRLVWVKQLDANNVSSWIRTFDWTDSNDGLKEHPVEGDEFDDVSFSLDQESWRKYQSSTLTDADGDGVEELHYDYPHVRWVDPTDVRIVVYDVDADGIDDVIYRTHPTKLGASQYWSDEEELLLSTYDPEPGNIRFRYWLSHIGKPLGAFIDATDYFEPSEIPDNPFEAVGNLWQAHLGKSRVADFDGDGRNDLLLARTVMVREALWKGPGDGADVWNKDHWWFGYVNAGAFDPMTASWNPARRTIIGRIGIQGPVFRTPADEGEDEYDDYKLFTPPFQHLLADLDGDGQIDHVDAFPYFAGDEPEDLLNHPDESWLEKESMHEARVYRGELSAHPGTVVPFNACFPTAGDEDCKDDAFVDGAAAWTCNNGRAIVTDYEGDGRADILAGTAKVGFFGPVGTFVRLTTPDDIGAPGAGILVSSSSSELWAGDCGATLPNVVVGDWNGDGLDDLLYEPSPLAHLNDDVPRVRFNLGNGFGPLTDFAVDDPSLGKKLHSHAPIDRNGSPVGWDLGTRAVDLNRDGRTDILAMRYASPRFMEESPGVFMSDIDPYHGPKIVIAYLSAGDHFVARQLSFAENAQISMAEGYTTFQVGEVTGDGAVDAIHVEGGHLVATELPWRTKPDMLASVGDSSTQYPLEVFTYTTSWWGSGDRPEPEEDCEYPLTCTRRAFPVVRQHSVLSSMGTSDATRYRTTLHQYADPRGDARGRGALGFAMHRIWDRQLGSETVRYFDNVTSFDTNGDEVPGGELYPYARRPREVIETTPTTLLPTAAEIAANGNFPGATGLTHEGPVHWTRALSYYEVRPGDDGRTLAVLPSSWERREADLTAVAKDLGSNPHYASWDEHPAEQRVTSGSTTYDDYGNPLVEKRETVGGVTTTVRRTFENRVTAVAPQPNPWLLGLVIRSEVSAHTQPTDVTSVERRAYDASGRVTDVWKNAQGPSTQPCVVDPSDGECELLGTHTVYSLFDARGNVRRITQTAFDDPMPRVTDVVWDVDGVFPAIVLDPLGFPRTRLIHPAFGVPVLETDANGVTSKHKYDGFGRPRQSERPGAPTFYRTYQEGTPGLIVFSSSSDGAESRVLSDPLGNVYREDARGYNGTWSYVETETNLFGLTSRRGIPTTTMPAAYASTFTYDRMGRLRETVSPENEKTTRAYTLLGTTITDPGLHQRYTVLDLDGRVVESSHRDGSASRGGVSFDYGDFNLVTDKTDAKGNVTKQQRDPFGRVIAIDDPDAGLTTYGYDGFGQLRTEDRPDGELVDHEYDVLGRPTITDGAAGIEQRTYDGGVGGKHRLTQATSLDDVITTLAYDTYGRLRSSTQQIGSASHTIERRYDSQGRLAYLFYPAVSPSYRFITGYRYAYGQLLSVDDATSCGVLPDPATSVPAACTTNPASLWKVMARNARGSITGALFQNGLLEARQYEPDMGRLSRLSVAGTVTEYEYDKHGNLELRSDPNSGRAETFTYDLFHRLDTWTLTAPGQQQNPPTSTVTDYDYDDLGNLTRVKKGSTVTFSGVYDVPGRPSRLHTATFGGSTKTYTYDELGRQETGDGRTLTWNRNGQPETIQKGTDVHGYLYDAFGARVRRNSYDGSTTYVGGIFEHRQSITGGNSHTFLVQGEKGVVAQVDRTQTGTEKRYLVGDALSTVALVMKGASTVERAYFEPFGKRIDLYGNAVVDPDPRTTVGFTGQEEDDASLVNMGGRIYDRNQYRFLSPDPVIVDQLEGQTYNPYSYAINNPLRYNDPTGFSIEQPSPPPSGGEEEEDLSNPYTDYVPETPAVDSGPTAPTPSPVSSDNVGSNTRVDFQIGPYMFQGEPPELDADPFRRNDPRHGALFMHKIWEEQASIAAARRPAPWAIAVAKIAIPIIIGFTPLGPIVGVYELFTAENDFERGMAIISIVPWGRVGKAGVGVITEFAPGVVNLLKRGKSGTRVYALVDEAGDAVYYGKTNDVMKRLGEHANHPQGPWNGMQVISPELSGHQALALETSLIQRSLADGKFIYNEAPRSISPQWPIQAPMPTDPQMTILNPKLYPLKGK